MQNKPFDLAKMEYERIRKSHRKTALLWSLLPAGFFLLVALWFILPSLLTFFVIQNYKSGHYQTARVIATPLTWASPDRFIAVYNAGTVDTKLKDYDAADRELSEAVALAGQNTIRKCLAAQNLEIALKKHVTSLGALSSKAGPFQVKAQKVIVENKECFMGASSSGGASSSSGSSSEQTIPSDAQQKQLEQKEQKGRDRKEQFAQDETYDPSKARLKPW